MHELKSRGVSDVLVAVVDGLKGFPDAIEAVFPDATVQTCLVHLIRRSLAYASYKERRSSAEALKTLYRAPTAAAAEAALDAFEAGAWGEKHPAIARSWRCAWEQGVAVLRVLAADPAGDLHHQRDRKPEQHATARGANTRTLPERLGGAEAAISGAACGAADYTHQLLFSVVGSIILPMAVTLVAGNPLISACL